MGKSRRPLLRRLRGQGIQGCISTPLTNGAPTSTITCRSWVYPHSHFFYKLILPKLKDTNVDVSDHGLLPEQLTKDGQVWFHFARTSVAAFCLYFMTSAVACVTGLMGCWKASGDHLISTATLMLLASLCGAAGMGFWHGANFYEMEKVSI